MRDLDLIDRKILSVLQQDGRITMTDLAGAIGLSATPCTERVRRLEREGIISGYHAHVNARVLGYKLLVFVELRLHEKSASAFEQVSKELARIPALQEFHLVTGDFDYLVKARLADMADYRKLLAAIQHTLPIAEVVRSYVVVEELKESLQLAA